MKTKLKLVRSSKGRRMNTFLKQRKTEERDRWPLEWASSRKRNRWRMWTAKHTKLLFSGTPAKGFVRNDGHIIRKLKSLSKLPVTRRAIKTFGRRGPMTS